MKGSEDYGKPVGNTAVRAEKAKKYIDKEIKTLIEIIYRCGRPSKIDGHVFIYFGDLFQTWVIISKFKKRITKIYKKFIKNFLLKTSIIL